jgi:hypothetical protein
MKIRIEYGKIISCYDESKTGFYISYEKNGKDCGYAVEAKKDDSNPFPYIDLDLDHLYGVNDEKSDLE